MRRLGEVPFRSEEYRRQQEALGVGFYDPLAALAQPDHKVGFSERLMSEQHFAWLVSCLENVSSLRFHICSHRKQRLPGSWLRSPRHKNGGPSFLAGALSTKMQMSVISTSATESTTKSLNVALRLKLSKSSKIWRGALRCNSGRERTY